MKQILLLSLLLVFFTSWTYPVWCQNPFTSDRNAASPNPDPLIKNKVFIKLILWQNQLRQQMAQRVREVKSGDRLSPIFLLMGFAFAYGTLHAAGPGHNKFVVASYVLSHNLSLFSGLLFGAGIALVHGFSGILGVFGLRLLIQKGVGESMNMATTVTQLVSFSLIVFLGLAIAIKKGVALSGLKEKTNPKSTLTPDKTLLPWAVAVGLVPCPAVVMVMLFCLSMDAMGLGLLLSVAISLGMATTLCSVIYITIFGKKGIFQALPEHLINTIEGWVGVFAGVSVAAAGTLFLMGALDSFCQ